MRLWVLRQFWFIHLFQICVIALLLGYCRLELYTSTSCKPSWPITSLQRAYLTRTNFTCWCNRTKVIIWRNEFNFWYSKWIIKGDNGVYGVVWDSILLIGFTLSNNLDYIFSATLRINFGNTDKGNWKLHSLVLMPISLSDSWKIFWYWILSYMFYGRFDYQPGWGGDTGTRLHYTDQNIHSLARTQAWNRVILSATFGDIPAIMFGSWKTSFVNPISSENIVQYPRHPRHNHYAVATLTRKWLIRLKYQSIATHLKIL